MVSRAPGNDAPTETTNPPLAGSPVERLRPRTGPQILDAGFEIIRYRAGRIAVLLAVLHGPFFAASLWMTHQSGNGWFSLLIIRRLWDGPRFELAASAEVWWLTGSLACSLLGEMLFGVGLSTLVRHWVEGTDATAGSVLRTTGRRLPVILSVWLVALVVKAAGLALCGVGILLVLPHLSILAQVMSFERGNVASWISRSRQLVNRASERALFLTLMAPLLSFGALWTLRAGAAGGIGDVEQFTTVMGVVVTLVLLVARTSAMVLFYLDIRVRTEGLDLALRAPDALGPRS